MVTATISFNLLVHTRKASHLYEIMPFVLAVSVF